MNLIAGMIRLINKRARTSGLYVSMQLASAGVPRGRIMRRRYSRLNLKQDFMDRRAGDVRRG